MLILLFLDFSVLLQFIYLSISLSLELVNAWNLQSFASSPVASHLAGYISSTNVRVPRKVGICAILGLRNAKREYILGLRAKILGMSARFAQTFDPRSNALLYLSGTKWTDF